MQLIRKEPGHRRVSAALAFGLSAGAMFILLGFFGTARASAATDYQYVGSFGNVTAAGGPFSGPQRVAVNDDSGELYVVDRGNDVVRVYAPQTGDPFLAQIATIGSTATTNDPVGIAVDQASGDVYVTAPGNSEAQGKLVKFNREVGDPPSFSEDPAFTSPAQGASGTSVGSFGTVSGIGGSGTAAGGIAVDPLTGNVLLADPGRNVVHAIQPDGSPATVFPGVIPILPPVSTFNGGTSGTAFAGLRDIAVGPDGNIFVADDGGTPRVERFSATGAYVASVGPVPNGSGAGMVLALDQGTGELFVSSKPTSTASGHVYQFDADNVLVRDFGISTTGFNGYMLGMAVRSSDPGRLYALGSTAIFFGIPRVQIFDNVGELASPPDLVVEAVDPGSVSATDATFRGRVNPNGAETTWRFEYRRVGSGEAWSRSPVPDESAGAGTDFVDVSTSVDGLEPNTEYEVRLVGTSAGTPPTGLESDPPYVEFKTGLSLPLVEEPVVIAGATMAQVQGFINPRNSQTRFQVDYRMVGSDAWTHGPGGQIGDGGVTRGISARIRGLGPQTTYEFRLSAENEAGPDEATPVTRTTKNVLPARAFELVSPVPTGGVDISGSSSQAFASDDGDRVIFPTFYFPFPNADALKARYLASRDPEMGWATTPVESEPQGTTWQRGSGGVAGPQTLETVIEMTTSSLDLDDRNGNPDSAGSTAGEDIYRHWLDDDGLRTEWISRDPRVPHGTAQTDPAGMTWGGDSPVMSSMSANGDVIVFSSFRTLSDADTTSDSGILRLYKYSDGTVEFIGSRADGTVPASGSSLGGNTYDYNAVSRDGSRVAFQARRQGSQGDALYIQRDGETTLEASLESGVPPLGAPHPRAVQFWGADNEMKRVFFTSASRLTPDSGASQVDGSFSDLYMYDVEEEQLHNLTPRMDGGSDPTQNPSPADQAKVLGVVVASDDGKRVYFVADGQLDVEAGPGEATPSAAGRNLYMVQLDDSGQVVRTSFVTALAASDRPAIWDGASSGGNWVNREAHTSFDGHILAFSSFADLAPGQITAGEKQLYVYDDLDGTLTCASCPADGSAPVWPVNAQGDRALVDREYFDNGWTDRRRVSDTGSVYFNTRTSLLPADSNVWNDVYEYRDGELRLITTGAGDEGSTFFDASDDGSTVFFISRQALVPRDTEPGARKLYASRIGGGFEGSLTPPPPCWGDGCRARSSDAPRTGTIGSSSLRGHGNASPSRTTKSRNCVRPRKRFVRARAKLRQVRRQGRRVTRTRSEFHQAKHLRRSKVARRRAVRQVRKSTRRLKKCRRAVR